MGNYLSYITYLSPEIKYKKYGWKRDQPDHRDQKLYFTDSPCTDIDLRNNCSNIYNQQKLGSCCANVIAFLYEYENKKKNDSFIPSRLFIYYNERKSENLTDIDSGSSLRNSFKTINKLGICSEESWNYDISQFSVKPPQIIYDDGKKNKNIKYRKIDQRINQLKLTLKANHPIAFGISVYESFESIETYTTGIITKPKNDEKMLGGHSMVIIGFCDEKKMFIVRNSFGVEWGDKGYGYIPYDYIMDVNLASDFWMIENVKMENEIY